MNEYEHVEESRPEDFEVVEMVGVLRKVEAAGQLAESAAQTTSPSTAIP